MTELPDNSDKPSIRQGKNIMQAVKQNLIAYGECTLAATLDNRGSNKDSLGEGRSALNKSMKMHGVESVTALLAKLLGE